MSNVGVFVDLALAAVLLIALVMGWRQGFVQALTRILVVVAALLLAGWIAGKLAEPAARWLEPILSEKLEQRLTAQGNTDDAGEMLAAFGFEGDTLSELVDNAVEKAQQAGETLLSGEFGFRDFGFADLLDFGEFLLDFIGNPVQDSAAPFESKFVCAFHFDFSIK